MVTFSEYLFLESFDLDKVSYQVAPIKKQALETIYPYPNMLAWDFKANNTEYVVYKFSKNGATEFHFLDWTNSNDMGNNSIPMKDASKVFSTVLKIIHDLEHKGYMQKIRVPFAEDRRSTYTAIFKHIDAKWFPEFTSSEPYYYETLSDGNMPIKIYAFDLTRGKFSKGVGVEALKEEHLKIKESK